MCLCSATPRLFKSPRYQSVVTNHRHSERGRLAACTPEPRRTSREYDRKVETPSFNFSPSRESMRSLIADLVGGKIILCGADRSAERVKVYEGHVLRFRLRKAEPGPKPSRWQDQPTSKCQNMMRFQDISRSTICKVNKGKCVRKRGFQGETPGPREKVNKS